MHRWHCAPLSPRGHARARSMLEGHACAWRGRMCRARVRGLAAAACPMRITYRHEVRVPLSALVRSARRSSCSKATVLRTVGELALARSMAGVLRPLVGRSDSQGRMQSTTDARRLAGADQAKGGGTIRPRLFVTARQANINLKSQPRTIAALNQRLKAKHRFDRCLTDKWVGIIRTHTRSTFNFIPSWLAAST